MKLNNEKFIKAYKKRTLVLYNKIKEPKLKEEKFKDLEKLFFSILKEISSGISFNDFKILKMEKPSKYVRANTYFKEKIIRYNEPLINDLSVKTGISKQQILKSMTEHEKAHIVIKENKDIRKMIPKKGKIIWEEAICNLVAQSVNKYKFELSDIDIYYMFGKDAKSQHEDLKELLSN